MPAMKMAHEMDPREKLLSDLGDLNQIEVFNNQVLCAVYIRPSRTKSGIYLSDQTTDEDRFQSKVGLVVKMGSEAFVDASGKWFSTVDINLNDWVVFRPSDGWNITVNGTLCRMIDDVDIRGRVHEPDQVW